MDLISALLLKSLLVVDPKKKPGYEKLGKGTYKCKVCGAVIKVRGQ